MNDIEKEELFSDFMVRMAEMDKSEKTLRVASNNRALKGMTRYYNERKEAERRNGKLWYDGTDGKWGFKYYGMYQAYLELRHAVVFLVNAKHNKRNKIGCLIPEMDTKEAEKIGKILIDAMFDYLLESEE